MDFGDFLKNVRDASIAIPVIGGWTASLGKDQGDSAAGKAIESGFLKPGSMPIERTMQGMNWLYDNGISQPMSTFLLMGKQSRSGNDDPFAFSGNWFNASSWAKAWHTANHVSPGQAFWLNHSEGQQVLSANPVYATPGAAYLPDNWKDLPYEQQQELLKKAGMPVVGNEAVDKIRRDHSWFS